MIKSVDAHRGLEFGNVRRDLRIVEHRSSEAVRSRVLATELQREVGSFCMGEIVSIEKEAETLTPLAPKVDAIVEVSSWEEYAQDMSIDTDASGLNPYGDAIDPEDLQWYSGGFHIDSKVSW